MSACGGTGYAAGHEHAVVQRHWLLHSEPATYPRDRQPSCSLGTTMFNEHQTRVVYVHDLRSALSVPATVGLFVGTTEELGNHGMSLPHSISRASKKRQREFVAGRYCASRALKSAGH